MARNGIFCEKKIKTSEREALQSPAPNAYATLVEVSEFDNGSEVFYT